MIAENLDPCEFWAAADRPTLIFARPGEHLTGETESMTSLLKAAHRMGWNVIPAKKAQKFSREKLKNAFGIFIHNPMFEMATQELAFPKDIPLLIINNFVYAEHYLNPNQHLEKLIHLKSAYNNSNLCGVLAVTYPENKISLKKDRNLPNLKFIMNWYLTTAATYYQPRLAKLMYFGAPWKNIRTTEKYQKLWKQLDEKDYFAIYGGYSWSGLKSHKGYIPADGESFVKEINKNGICLVLHSEKHLAEGVPSGRIFEASAAAAVIISDKHPFVEREFKDSVLYIDVARDDLFEQIDSHMQWIRSHPAEAKEKARLAHAIFLQKFTQEQQLSKLYENLVQVREEHNVQKAIENS